MDFFLLCVTVFIMARYAGNRRVSPFITIAHTLLFVVLFFSLFFTTNFVPIQYTTQKFLGEATYQAIRAAIYTPCILGWSANAVLCVVEVVLLVIVAIGVTVFVAKKLLESKKPFVQKPSASLAIPVSPVSFFAAGNLLFLKYCRLLN